MRDMAANGFSFGSATGAGAGAGAPPPAATGASGFTFGCMGSHDCLCVSVCDVCSCRIGAAAISWTPGRIHRKRMHVNMRTHIHMHMRAIHTRARAGA